MSKRFERVTGRLGTGGRTSRGCRGVVIVGLQALLQHVILGKPVDAAELVGLRGARPAGERKGAGDARR